jgi:RNA 2',3'-cyclic 3'-phosphodiesterase
MTRDGRELRQAGGGGDRRRGARSLLRIFLAVFPPREVRQSAHALAESLRRPNDGVSWVKPDNLHFTLRFIGDVGEDGAGRVEQAARDAAASHTRFDAVLGELGAFPNARRARAIWVGLADGQAELVAVARDLEAALRQRGFDRADHPFSPHLTLGRVRERGQDWSERLSLVPAPEPAPRFRVDRIAVVQSQLSPAGSIYSVRAEAVFGAASSAPGPAPGS